MNETICQYCFEISYSVSLLISEYPSKDSHSGEDSSSFKLKDLLVAILSIEVPSASKLSISFIVVSTSKAGDLGSSLTGDFLSNFF
jgi:hypothetical protein